MSVLSKKSAAKKKLAIDRPFDPKILRRARDLANNYRLILEPDQDEGFVGHALEMPMSIGVGKTADECVRETREILVTVIATMLERGERPPSAVVEGKREEQINIRVTAEEKLLLEEAARSRGFRGVSDFVRTATLAAVRE